jgi:hypothetical protein
MSTTTTMPCRVPPPGDARAQAVPGFHDATTTEHDAKALTLGEKVLLDHLRGRVHFRPLCRLCGSAA